MYKDLSIYPPIDLCLRLYLYLSFLLYKTRSLYLQTVSILGNAVESVPKTAGANFISRAVLKVHALRSRWGDMGRLSGKNLGMIGHFFWLGA